MRRPWGIIVIFVLLSWTQSSLAKSPRKTGMKGGAVSDSQSPITLQVTPAGPYLAGFPMLILVDIRNTSTGVFESLQPFGLLDTPCPVEFFLRGGGHEWHWRAKGPRMEEDQPGPGFGPGDSLTALQDLSELHSDVPPGHFELSATLQFLGDLVRAPPVPIEVKASSSEDRALAGKLRSTNDERKSSWFAFIRKNWSTPDTHRLSPTARSQLALYLYLHHVAYGPTAIAALDPEEPWVFGRGILEGEAAVLRLEILQAAGKPEAQGIAAGVLERWPGFSRRVKAIQAGGGMLSYLRRYGVEATNAPRDRPKPYARP